MNSAVEMPCDRREFLNAGLLAGAGLVGVALAGCSSSPGSKGTVGQPLPEIRVADPGRRRPPTQMPGTAPAQDLAALPGGVIPRRQWTAAAPIASLANPMVRVERITVHHDAINSADLRTRSDVAHRIERIRASHVGNGWADIGYHFVIDPLGNVWEGRPLRYQGAHVKVANERNLGVVLLGNYMEQRPTPASLAAMDAFLASQMRRFGVPLARVRTHQELSPTACPGTSLQRHMVDTRSGRGSLARSVAGSVPAA